MIYTAQFAPPARRASNELPRFVHDLIASPPAAGTGLHGWLFRVARQLHAHRAPDEIERLLAAAVEGCGRHVPAREIQHAVKNSGAHAWQPGASRAIAPGGTSVADPPRWPAVDEPLRASVLATGFGLSDLYEANPVRFDTAPDVDGLVASLFPGNPLLCVATRKERPVTLPREALRGRLAGLQLIVPSPMTTPHGRTTDGRTSARCLGNTGPRRFIVAESDIEGATADEQAAVLGHLADFAPLALVVHSGRKSLHGWYRAHPDEAVCRRFFEYAVKLGADPATWCRCQFVRMPGGIRDTGARQVVWYFRPEVCA